MSWGKVLKKCEKVWKSARKCENAETILPFSCCPLVFLWLLISGTSPLSSGVRKRVVFKGWFWEMFPVTKKPELGYIRLSPLYQKPERGCMRMFPSTENRNEGIRKKPQFYETALCFPQMSAEHSRIHLVRRRLVHL